VRGSVRIAVDLVAIHVPDQVVIEPNPHAL
jgi:hypothetical protein